MSRRPSAERRGPSAARLAVVVLLLAACGEPGVPSERSATVEMFDNRFEAPEVHLPVGGSVTFVGAGETPTTR